jgi:hypothetical protein
MFNQVMFDKIVGPTSTLAEVQAFTPRGLDYYNRWTQNIDDHWNNFGAGFYDGATGAGDAGSMTNVHQYDRGIQYYGWWKMSGYTNNTWRDRARATTIAYRDQLLYAGGTQIYLHEMKQLAAHYAETGDTETLRCLGDQGDMIAYSWVDNIPPSYGAPMDVPPNEFPYPSGVHELRPWQRAFETMICCEIANAPSDGSPSHPGGNNWRAEADWCLERILANQYPDGYWRARDTMITPHGPGLENRIPNFNIGESYVGWPYETHQDQNYPWVVRPFFNFLIGNVLILYYQAISPDPRIITALKNQCDALFTGAANVWVPGPDVNGQTNSFKYLERQTFDEHYAVDPYQGWRTGDPVWPASNWGPGGPWPPPESADGKFPNGTPGPNGSPDLNGLGLNIPAFVYHHTGIEQYKTWAAAMLDGPAVYAAIRIADGGSHKGKRWNESWTYSYRAFPDMINAPVVSGGTPTYRLNWV